MQFTGVCQRQYWSMECTGVCSVAVAKTVSVYSIYRCLAKTILVCESYRCLHSWIDKDNIGLCNLQVFGKDNIGLWKLQVFVQLQWQRQYRSMEFAGVCIDELAKTILVCGIFRCLHRRIGKDCIGLWNLQVFAQLHWQRQYWKINKKRVLKKLQKLNQNK